MTAARSIVHRAAVLAAAGLSLVAAPSVSWGQDRVDAVVATVSSRPITASEVLFEEQVRVLASRGGNPAAFGYTLSTSSALDAVLAREALLRSAPPDSGAAEEVARDRARRLMLGAGPPSEARAFLARWGMGEEELVAWFRDLVRAEAAAEGRLEQVQPVSPEEVEARWSQDPGRYAPFTFPDAAAAVAADLARERVDAAWERVIQEVLARADVRLLAPRP